jgi:nucleotide-binding universal stress UspA family protein
MKILVPVDGSVYSLEAVKVALEFVKMKGAEVFVISVIPYIGGMEEHEISPARRDRHMEAFGIAAEEAVKKACDFLSAAGIQCASSQSILAPASVPDAIIDFAEKEGMDLIVMGSRGMSPSARFKLGSVASQVAKYSPCSIHLVKMKTQ